MNAVVLSLETLAVTEYDSPYTGVSGRFETDLGGLHVLDATDDNGVPIGSGFTFGLELTGETSQRRAEYLYVHGAGVQALESAVTDSRGVVYPYSAIQRHDRVARFKFGRGIRDSHLQYGLACAGEQPYAIDRVSFETLEPLARRM